MYQASRTLSTLALAPAFDVACVRLMTALSPAVPTPKFSSSQSSLARIFAYKVDTFATDKSEGFNAGLIPPKGNLNISENLSFNCYRLIEPMRDTLAEMEIDFDSSRSWPD